MRVEHGVDSRWPGVAVSTWRPGVCTSCKIFIAADGASLCESCRVDDEGEPVTVSLRPTVPVPPTTNRELVWGDK
jgi:hypothetical protein